MKNYQIIIFDFKILFNILDEIKEYLNFELTYVSKENYKKLFVFYSNSVVISKNSIDNLDSNIVIKDFPFKIKKFIEIVNTNFLKNQFNVKSNQTIGKYKLDFNSKIITRDKTSLNLTEKELKLIDFLKNSKNPITIIELQKKVWGYISTLETHTVETHVYRLRKKILKTFGDKNFIVSNKNGYYIN